MPIFAKDRGSFRSRSKDTAFLPIFGEDQRSFRFKSCKILVFQTSFNDSFKPRNLGILVENDVTSQRWLQTTHDWLFWKCNYRLFVTTEHQATFGVLPTANCHSWLKNHKIIGRFLLMSFDRFVFRVFNPSVSSVNRSYWSQFGCLLMFHYSCFGVHAFLPSHHLILKHQRYFTCVLIF